MDLQTIGVSLSGSAAVAFAIVKTLVRAEARKELATDVEKLHERINEIEKDYVTCKFCNTQHDNLNTNIADIKGTVSKIYEWIINQK
jgi:enoyl-[acyl-carrier-protein] reductase (NADH)